MNPFEYGDPFIEWEEFNASQDGPDLSDYFLPDEEYEGRGPFEAEYVAELTGHGYPFPITVVRRADVPGEDY